MIDRLLRLMADRGLQATCALAVSAVLGSSACSGVSLDSSARAEGNATRAGSPVRKAAPPLGLLADECRLLLPDALSDVRGAVALSAAAGPGRATRLIFTVDGKALGATLAGAARSFSGAWRTDAAEPDGQHRIQALCLDKDGHEVSRSDERVVWLSNKLGAMLGTNGSLSREHVDSSAEGLGVRWLRGGPEWGFHPTEADFIRDVEAKKRGSTWPGLVKFRDEVAYAHQRGLRVLVVAMGAARWARGADRTDGGNPWHQAILPSKREHFAEYVKQLCAEGADAVEVINEPNLQSEYSFGPDHPRFSHPDERVDDYVALLQVVYRHVKSDPTTARCLIGTGGTAASGHEMIASSAHIHPVLWYRQLFHAKADDRSAPLSAAGYFDFASVHPYADANTQDGPTEWSHRWLRFSLQYGDAAYGHGMAMVTRIRDILVGAGQGDKKLWATEVGVATFGGSCTKAPCTSDETQAKWVQQYVKAWFTSQATGWHTPLATRFYGSFTGPMFYYQWRDRSNGELPPTDKEGFFGLVHFDGTPKPAFDELRAQAEKRRP